MNTNPVFQKENPKGQNPPAAVQAPMGENVLTQELSGEFNLPDYQPEIKRLLRVGATVGPASRYLGTGNAEFSGNVDFDVLYMGSDGGIYCYPATLDYHYSTQIDDDPEFDLAEGVICYAECTPEMVVGRVNGPRKVSVKCRLRSRVRAYGMRNIEEQITGNAPPTSIRKLTASVPGARLFIGMGEAITLNDESIPDRSEGEIRVACAQGRVFVTEATATSEAVNCRGELQIRLMICHEGEGIERMPTITTRKIPFQQTVSMPGVSAECECCVRGYCPELSVTVDDGRILCEATVQLETEAQCNMPLCYTRDLYAIGADGNSEMREMTFPTALRAQNGNMTQSDTLTLSELGIPADARVVDMTGIATATDVQKDGGRCAVLGKCRYTLLLAMPDGEMSAQDIEVPFRYRMECGEGEPKSMEAAVTVLSGRARIDGERLGIDAELALALRICGESSIRVVRAAHFEKKEEEMPIGGIRVCYPTGSDNLWSVSKRYGYSPEAMAGYNHLPETNEPDSATSLSGVKFLLIPQKRG